MFARFSPEAIKAVMLAQQAARDYGLTKVGVDALLYGLVATGSLGTGLESESRALRELLATKRGQAQIVALEIPWSSAVESSFNEAPRVADTKGSTEINPEHILHALIDYPEFYDVLHQAGINLRVFTEKLGFPRITPAPQTPRKQVRVGAKPRKSLREYFSEASIDVVADAVALAKNAKVPQVTPAHLASVLKRKLTTLPLQAMGSLELLALAEMDQHQSPHDEPEIGEHVMEVFFAAKEQANYLASEHIEPIHFVLAMLCKGGSGQARLYQEIVESANQSEKPPILPKEKPLLEDDLHVRCTNRLARTLKSAMTLAMEAPPGLKHLLLALSHEARNSEATFLENRDDSLRKLEGWLATWIETENVTQPNDRSDALRRVVSAASLHAQRLNCARLDLNHFAIALLDEQSEAVDAFVAVFAEPSHPYSGTDRRGLKKRLESCVQFQAAQNLGYQREPGVLINLYDITGSLKNLSG